MKRIKNLSVFLKAGAKVRLVLIRGSQNQEKIFGLKKPIQHASGFSTLLQKGRQRYAQILCVVTDDGKNIFRKRFFKFGVNWHCGN